MIGKEYFPNCELLVVGQAVNQWISPRFKKGDDQNALEKHIKQAMLESQADQ